MSEKIKEFTEIPQQFVREGNQVCAPPTARTPHTELQMIYSSLHVARSQRKKVIAKHVANVMDSTEGRWF
jgi:hypothetical protein